VQVRTAVTHTLSVKKLQDWANQSAVSPRDVLLLACLCIQVYDEGMEIVWDPEKAIQNAVKHGVRFPDAVLVLDDPYAITIPDTESDPAEARWVTLGADAQGRVLVVVYTYRGDDIRLISARTAAPRELKEYEAQV
jgi:uncharacterized protein